ncbi:hypothetical protein DM860_017149 [Cuscuta australis]|uniref:Uncharacterized protein n=1 Tax=Cuscuta australis TaxID=267555 RepID=A0A328DAV4_9ASTE|nr:hypothetical protein DM860_017149 [Cuscuta australis]
MDDRVGGNPVTWDETQEFKQCVQVCGLEEIPAEGTKFTWSNKQGPGRRIFSKIDRALANIEWFNEMDTKVHIKVEGLSDHSPLLIKNCSMKSNFSFKFCDMWTLDPSFPKIVKENWSKEVQGRYMYKLVTYLKEIKGQLRQLNKDKFSNIFLQCNVLREELQQTQEAIKNNMDSIALITKERDLIRELNWKMKAARLLKFQQIKQEWVLEGDKDSRLFHAWIKKRRLKNYINTIKNSKGQIVEGNEKVAQVMVEYYQDLLGNTKITDNINIDILAEGKVLTVEQQLKLLAPIHPEEVKKYVFSIPNSKSPGPDGFSSGFFKHQWRVVGETVTKAVLDFFQDGVTLQQINATNICLIPKVDSPESPKDFRPIDCCNVVYKVISKIICSRLKDVLAHLINPNQSAFIEG